MIHGIEAVKNKQGSEGRKTIVIGVYSLLTLLNS